MSIEALIQAAEFLERREREAEHGYASPLPHPNDLTRRRPKSKKSQGNRSTHNELEKNRRAHLRNCLEKLKELVPLGPESNRHTTLGLLTRAKAFIKNLEEKERRHRSQKEHLLREQRHLFRKLAYLRPMAAAFNTHNRRSPSESSSGSASSPPPSIGYSETDEVDICGYTSNQSDTDDHSSIESITSDGGMTVSTKRLTLSDHH